MNRYTVTLVDEYGKRTQTLVGADSMVLTDAGGLYFTVLGNPVRAYARGEWVKAEKS
ncbi:hypothetical protein D9M71_720300 [compost metagenome]